MQPPDPAALPSPCVGICILDPVSGWCRGCFRSIEEIAAWREMSLASQSAVLRELPGRRAGAYSQKVSLS